MMEMAGHQIRSSYLVDATTKEAIKKVEVCTHDEVRGECVLRGWWLSK
jgi:hypothetical protein